MPVTPAASLPFRTCRWIDIQDSLSISLIPNHGKLALPLLYPILTLVAIITGGTLGASLGLAQAEDPGRKSESIAIENYLDSLGLDELVVEHLEFETARQLNADARRSMASRLLNEYASRMISGRDPSDTKWQSKTQLLLKTYPELVTPHIQIAILQAQYLHGEKSFRDWWGNGRPSTSLALLTQQWRQLDRELQSLNQRLNSDYDSQAVVLQTLTENRMLEAQRLVVIEGQILNTEYLLGWTSYFLGILQADTRESLMGMSDAHFRTFLQVEPNRTLNEVPADWFDFSSDWNSRALVGLGMCQRGLDHPLQSKYCFDLIGENASSQTRDLRFVWELNSLAYLDEVSAAREYVESIGEARHVSQSGRIAFWIATLKASLATRSRSANVSRSLLRSGLAGLTREFQDRLLETFIEENNILLDGDDFTSRWVDGYLSFATARTQVGSDKYNAAKSKLTSALEARNETTNPNDLARCRFLLGRIQFHERQFEIAANTFQGCSDFLNSGAPELAAEAQWMAIRSLAELSRLDSRNLIKANRAIDNLLRRFPGSTFADRAAFEKLRVNITHLPSENAINRLQRISPESPNYARAMNEIVKTRYRDWTNANQANSDQVASKLELLLESEQQFSRVTGLGNESKLKAKLLTIDALLKSGPSQLANVSKQIESAQQVSDSGVSMTPATHQELHYYQFMLAIGLQDEARADAEAEWIFKRAAGTRFEKSATTQLAQVADTRLRAQTAPALEETLDAIRIFERLVRLIAPVGSDIKQSPNARVAMLRLAELNLGVGESKKAIDTLERLIQVFPDHKSVLLLLAKGYQADNLPGKSISIWQKLIRGVSPGTGMWFEAKYNLTKALLDDGQASEAGKLYKQTLRLCPSMPEPWQQAFADLEPNFKNL